MAGAKSWLWDTAWHYGATVRGFTLMQGGACGIAGFVVACFACWCFQQQGPIPLIGVLAGLVFLAVSFLALGMGIAFFIQHRKELATSQKPTTPPPLPQGATTGV